MVVEGREVLKLRGASSQSTNRIRASREMLNKPVGRNVYFDICQYHVLPNPHISVVGDVRIRPGERTLSDAVRKASSLSSSLASIFSHQFGDK